MKEEFKDLAISIKSQIIYNSMQKQLIEHLNKYLSKISMTKKQLAKLALIDENALENILNKKQCSFKTLAKLYASINYGPKLDIENTYSKYEELELCSLQKLEHPVYKYVVINLTYMEATSEIPNIEYQLKNKYTGKILFDLMVKNGKDAFNRFLEAEFDGQQVIGKSFKVLDSIDASIHEFLNSFYTKYNLWPNPNAKQW